MKKDKITVLLIEAGKKPVKTEIDNSLESFQKLVGGYIECTYPYEELVGLVCNENGKIDGLPMNRAMRTDYGKGEVYDIICGTFFITGLGKDGNFRSLNDKEILQFGKIFYRPELFYRTALGQLVIEPQTEENHQKFRDQDER